MKIYNKIYNIFFYDKLRQPSIMGLIKIQQNTYGSNLENKTLSVEEKKE